MIRWFTQSKKRTLVVLSGLAVLAVAVAAVAYFTSTGSGTGSATVGSASGTQLSSPTVSTLYPGGADVPVTVSIHNPTQASNRRSENSCSVGLPPSVRWYARFR